MSEAGGGGKAGKPPRRLRSGDNLASSSRQVRFGEASNSNDDAAAQPGDHDSSGNNSSGNRNTQPASFPALGALPGSVAPGWFVAADPSRSLAFAGPTVFYPQQPGSSAPSCGPGFVVPPGALAPGAPPHHRPLPQASWPGAASSPAMADYSNTGPPPFGAFNYQPPVPDTTFGPIPHLYVPRFDAGPVAPNAGAVPVAQQGYFVGQPSVPGQAQQPVMINGQAYYPAPAGHHPPGYAVAPGQPFPAGPQMMVAAAGGGAPVPLPFGVPGMPGNGNNAPEVAGVGRTPNEEMLRQIQFAHQNKLFEPQDFKPGDDDPSRFYFVREVDGNWTQRNRYTIDQLACRWYVTDEGWFYAVRLPD
ncbi:hypothetical protein CDD83_4240 [Cordyceps sp. RAO-2017]|nr:hypothetical protein CDD83_4240 [Cordyceps sp. RAO-2017]